MKFRHTLIALALAAPISLLAMADGMRPAAARADAPFRTTAEQSETATLVQGLLSESRFAYRPRPLDATLSQEVFKRYLEALDHSKVYLTATDVARFDGLRDGMGDALRSGNVDPAFGLFQLYRQRVKERSAYARALLKQDIYDFGGQDRFEYDREDAKWAASAAELDAYWKQAVRYDWLRLKLAGKQPDEIRTTLDKRYANVSRNLDDINAEDVFQTILNAYTGSIDPHTDYLNPRAAERFNQAMSLSLEGIGAQLQKRDEMVTIMELIPGGPAARSQKLKIGDRIIGVGQGVSGAMEDVVGWRIDDVVAKIKGKKGTDVRLDILPAEAPLDGKPNRIQLVRDKIVLADSKAKSEVINLPAAGSVPARRIGVVKLPAFYEDFQARGFGDGASSSRDVGRILEQFRADGVDGVVLDLRNNGGGSLNEAVRITGFFIDRGPVVQEQQAGGRIGVRGDNDAGAIWDGPLAVLINRASASASEIVAGAIQDYGRGLIIGETSFGKGTVQAMVDLNRAVPNRAADRDYGEVKLTIAEFFRPSGSSTQHKGVVPDIPFPLTVDADEYGESTYDNALPWSSIPEAQHVRYGQFDGILPGLVQMHDARVRSDREYQWRAEDAAEFREQRARKSIVLNEAERRAERARDDAKRSQRQAERKRLGLAPDPLAGDASDDGLQAGERDVAREAERGKLADQVPDPFLRETAHILGDAMRVLNGDRALAAQVLPQSTQAGSWVK